MNTKDKGNYQKRFSCVGQLFNFNGSRISEESGNIVPTFGEKYTEKNRS